MLEENQILEIAKKGQSNDVKSGLAYESRLRVFTEEKTARSLNKETGWSDFIHTFISSVKNKNFNRIKPFIKYPLSSVSITNTINSDINRVFNAGNSFFEFKTIESFGGEKINSTLDGINIVEWIAEQGKKTLKNEANNIVVIDKDDQGNIYPLIVNNDRLLSFELKDNKIDFKWICFLHSTEVQDQRTITRYAIYDDVNYNVVSDNNGTWQLESSVTHTVGYCPARMFLDEQKDSDNDLCRSIPVSKVLGKLEDWQIFDIEKVYAKNFVPFPVIEMERQSCGHDECDSGWRQNSEGNKYKCPDCQEANNIFLGARILNDPQADREEVSSFGKYKEHHANTEGIKYLSEDNNISEGDIIQKATGRIPKTEGQAINEVQAKSEVEAQETILFSIKQNLDSLTKWVVETIAYSYSNTAKIEVYADWGTEWYLIDEEILKERFETAKKAGLPKPEIDNSYKRYISTKYKGDTTVARRMILLNLVDPDPYSDLTFKILKKQNGLITGEDLYLSENIVSIINQFEGDNGSITEYAPDLTIEEQAKKIKELINPYIKYEQPKEPAPETVN